MTIKSLIKRPRMRVFRRVSIKRRTEAGDYETSWQSIPDKYLKKYGHVEYGLLSDIKPNFFRYNGITFEFNNEDSYFNDVNDSNSFFYGYLSRYRSLVKLEAGYLDDSDVEYPTNSTIFLGIVGEGIELTDKGVFKLQTNHISKVFDEFPADQVAGLGTPQSASDIITKMVNHTDAIGNEIFKKYISVFNIDTTTTLYNIATSTTLQGNSCWQIMRKMAEAEDKLLYITPDGEFTFKTAVASSAVWHFSGANDNDYSYGKNIFDILRLQAQVKNVYNRVKIQHDKSDTITSYYIKGESWTWGDSSSSFKYGVREYEYKNEWLDSLTAITVGDAMYEKLVTPKIQIKFKSKYLPNIKIGDTVTVTHNTGKVLPNAAYNDGDYGRNYYGAYVPGSVNLINQDAIINKLSHNVDSFYTVVTMEAV